MFCKKCGSAVKDGDRFCPKCGTEIRMNVVSDNQNADNRNADDQNTDIQSGTVKKGNKILIIAILIALIFLSLAAIAIVFLLLESPSAKNNSEEIKIEEKDAAELEYDEDSAFSMNTDANMEWAAYTKEGYAHEAGDENAGNVNWAQLYYDWIDSNIDEYSSSPKHGESDSAKNEFLLADITSDGVPELFINEPGFSASEDSNYFHTCTIVDGMVVDNKFGKYLMENDSGYFEGAGCPAEFYTEGYVLFSNNGDIGWGTTLYQLKGSKLEKISQVYQTGWNFEYELACSYINYQTNKEFSDYHNGDEITYEGDYSGICAEEMIYKDIPSTAEKINSWNSNDIKDKSEMLKYLMSLGAAGNEKKESSDDGWKKTYRKQCDDIFNEVTEYYEYDDIMKKLK